MEKKSKIRKNTGLPPNKKQLMVAKIYHVDPKNFHSGNELMAYIRKNHWQKKARIDEAAKHVNIAKDGYKRTDFDDMTEGEKSAFKKMIDTDYSSDAEADFIEEQNKRRDRRW